MARVYIKHSPSCGTAWAEVRVEGSERRVILDMEPGDSSPTDTLASLVHTSMVRVAPGDCVQAVATVYFNNKTGHWPPKTVKYCIP